MDHNFIRQGSYNAIGELQFASVPISQMPPRRTVAPTRCRFWQFGVEAYASAGVPAAGPKILALRRFLAANSYFFCQASSFSEASGSVDVASSSCSVSAVPAAAAPAAAAELSGGCGADGFAWLGAVRDLSLIHI